LVVLRPEHRFPQALVLLGHKNPPQHPLGHDYWGIGQHITTHLFLDLPLDRLL